MTTTDLGRFDIGRVIQRLFAVLGRNAASFGLAAVLFSAIPQAIVMSVTIGLRAAAGAGAFNLGLSAWSLLGSLITAIGSVLLQGILIFGTVSDLNGRRPSLAEMLQVALRVALPLIGVALVTGIGVVLGLILLIVPGIILALMWCVATPARVVEPIGVIDALSRSQALTRGHRWIILGLWVLILVVTWVVMTILSLVGLAAGGIAAFVSMAMMTPALGSPLWLGLVIVQPLVNAAIALVAAAGIASLYYELRTVKDGAGADDLAAAFA
jgi:hypothetical protein